MNPMERQRGTAIIMALIVVTVVAALATSLFQRQTASTRQFENALARAQARELLAGGTDWARLILREHGRQETLTTLQQVWATPVLDTRIERPGDDRVAVFTGRIEDEQGKFNLYGLARGGVPQPEALQALARLLQLQQLPEGLADTLLQAVMAAQAPAAGEQTALAQAPLPRGMAELADRLGLRAPVRAALMRTMTLLPASTSVNINTAPAEVIAALVPDLSLSQARALAGERDRGNWFNNSGDFANRLAAYGVQATPPGVATTSGWFMASGTLVYERARVGMQALLHSAPPAVPQTTWIRELP
ncbi:type II secretion system minor pseudopilin GspK [Bordetella hinzii]|uniref:Type II secretion system protein K n=1 Tax=Bordetella hinzii OH87 BAL007II TaxID=1331262 RepID=A0ABR4QWI2_9BORD|nr:type II secretion system minor pseudopilin GspK [Bordetella hinzii]KCB21782.1 type II secretion system protein K [Bordetella hinzii OH87 BAL007II]KCB39722.1 type II secretion system protein K [Bordetella hinzii 5132]KCB46805.1 type II secretion system protein K [Bordetella hinzii 1277]QDJ40968.1 general secretion pathway protein GspK [Bordetella hinzii]QDJ49948.1 general secretion pathway protein GspK [Bordetella hinzii]